MRALLLLTAFFALALPVSAEDCCDGWCHETVRAGTPDTPAGQHDVVWDMGCQPACLPGPFSVWVYEESNGIDGLQRKDDVRDDTCGRFPGDTIVF